MVGHLVLRGLIVGIFAGILAFGFAKVYGEPPVEAAIALEAAHGEEEAAAHAASGESVEEEHEMFSRGVQSGIGLFTGTVAIGAGIGAIFGVLFALSNGRIGNLGPGATSTLLGLLGLWSVYVIPALKYPPNPPAVGEADTIQLRTGLYFLMIAISIAATIGAFMVRRNLIPKFGSWLGSVIAFAAYLVVISTFFAILPNINEVPATFPAVTLYQFRLASLGIQLVLWGSTGLMFGYLAERMMGSSMPGGRAAAMR